MQPLRVTARLASPVALPQGTLALDALLMAAVAIRDNLPPLSVTGSPAPLEIPVARSECGRVFLASFADFTPEERELQWVNRRFPVDVAQGLGNAKLRRVQINGGLNRSYRIPLEATAMLEDEVRWWCVGEPEGIRELLGLVTHLGKRRAVGKGRVAEWLVEECEPWGDGFPVVREGRPLRPLPPDWPGLVDPELAYCVLSPPYWERRREEVCAVPPVAQ